MTPQQKKTYENLLANYGDHIPREDVFVLLGSIQDAAGCIPRAALEEVARKSGFSTTRLYGAATAYPALTIEEA